MPISEEVTKVNDSRKPEGNGTPQAQSPDPNAEAALKRRERSQRKSNPITSLGSLTDAPLAGSEMEAPEPSASRSRWVNWDTHELLSMISQLEDERRWARLREGIWIAILIHLVLLSLITWIPIYVLKQPRVIDPFSVIKNRKDLTYLDMPPNAIKNLQSKVKPKPLPEKRPLIDRKTLEELRKTTPPKPAPKPEQQPKVKAAIPAPVAPAKPAPQAPKVETPRPAAVPARPNFAMNSMSPAQELRQAMKGAMSNPGTNAENLGGGGLAMHPGATSGGVQVLSNTEGVDFTSWLQRWHYETERTWDPLIPDEVNPPILKKGEVLIRFKILPNGRLMPGSMVLEGRSGDVALDRAAWGAITGSNYPPLPKAFHGPYIELRALFMYNMQPPQ